MPRSNSRLSNLAISKINSLEGGTPYSILVQVPCFPVQGQSNTLFETSATMNTEETAIGGNQEREEEIIMKPTGGDEPPSDGILAQKVQEIMDLKEKISSLEAESADLQTLVAEHASKMMSAIESSEESKRRARETSSRLEEVLQQLDQANSTVSALQKEHNMLKSVASRAAELEIQVVRLQHDLISTMNEMEEMTTEMKEVQKAAESKELVIKDLENERDSLKEKVKEQDNRLEIIARELEESLLQSKSKLEEEKHTLDNANKKLMSVESQCELQDQKIRALETHLREGELDRKKAADALMEKQAEVGRLVRELDGLKSQLKETLEEKRVLEELSKKNDTKLREENEAIKKKLDVEVGSLNLKEKEIKALEKTVGDLRTKLGAAEAEHKGLIEKFESSGPGNSKEVPAQEAVGKMPWPLAAAASTGTLAAAAFMAYLKYSKQR